MQLFIFARGLEFTGHFVMLIGCIPRCNSSDWEKSNNVMLIRIIYLITCISKHICFEWVSFWLNYYYDIKNNQGYSGEVSYLNLCAKIKEKDECDKMRTQVGK